MKILTWDRDNVIIQQRVNIKGDVPPNFFNPLFQCYTNTRCVKIRKVFPIWYLQAILATDTRLRIYTILSHELLLTKTDREWISNGLTTKMRIADRLRVKHGGEPYIDEFGLYVYVHHRLGYHDDMDLRYDGIPEPELFNLELIENDIPDRRLRS